MVVRPAVACKLPTFRAKAVVAATLAAALPAAPAALSQDAMAPPKVTASSVYVLDADTGRPLYRKNENKEARLHSLTKLVTAEVLAEQMGDRLGETVTIAPKHLTTGATAGLRKGDVWTLSDLLAGMLLVSGNDAANAIAEATGQSMLAAEGKQGDATKRFVKAMNETAARAGATSARFADPSGLSPTNVASAKDMAAIGAAAFRDPRLRPYWRCKSRTLSVGGPAAREVPLKTTVEVLGEDRVLGAKSGSHLGHKIFNLAGAWLAPNGDTIVIVNFGSASNEARYADFRAIIAALPQDYAELAVPASAGAVAASNCPDLPRTPAP
jgi:D-alanyl-D-alanine carboxypeptidase (penicillin-binding protein 5/6)